MPIKDQAARREYHRRWAAARRAEFFTGKTCKCGSTKKLTLTRKDTRVKADHKVWSWSKDRREEALRKFTVLCVDCHARWWRKSFYRPRQHGTAAMHRYGGCRCDKCSLWRSGYMKEYRRRRKEREARVTKLYAELVAFVTNLPVRRRGIEPR